jgi:Uma2 family endonuclease
MATRTRATVDDVLRLASEGERYELVDGELVEMAPTNFEHGDIEWHIAWIVGTHVKEHSLGKVVVGEVLFQLDPEGRLALAADVAFVRRERLPSTEQATHAFGGAPDLAVEIISPGDSAEKVLRTIEEWLEHGTEVVLVVYPDSWRVGLWRQSAGIILHGDQEVDLDPVLPGFRCRADDLFPPSLDEAERQTH